MKGHDAKGGTGVATKRRRTERSTLPDPYEQRLCAIEDERAELHQSIDRVISKLAKTVDDDSNEFAIPVDIDDKEDSLVVRMYEAMPAVRR